MKEELVLFTENLIKYLVSDADMVKVKDFTDDDGNIVLDNTGNSAGGKVIYEANAANTMTNVLKGVLIRGTGRKYQIDNAICAAKTGTTNNNYDSWFVGYSYYYTTSVWCGYDMQCVQVYPG